MAKQTVKRAPGADRILDAALGLAATMRWRQVTMERIAAEAGTTLQRVHELFPSKSSLLAAFLERTDRAVLAGHDPEDAGEPVRERMLDVLMRRFDALAAHKEAVRSIVREAGCDPLTLVCTAPNFARSMAWSLEAAGINADGPMGALRVKGLGAIYLAGMRVWLKDDTEDMSLTMAQLDKGLRRAEALISAVSRRGGAREAA